MEAQIARKGAARKPLEMEGNYFMIEGGGASIAFESFTSSKVGQLKNKPDQEYSERIRAFLQSKDFETGFSKIKRISAKAGELGLEVLSKEERKQFGNFSANFNAIVKNNELFSIFKDVFNSNESFEKSVREVFRGNVKKGFNKVSELLIEGEELGVPDRLKLILML